MDLSLNLEAAIIGGSSKGLVVFLVSDRANAITSATFQVDGGMLKGLF